jgi:myo-inositol 2-dehydrogenase/D-chiro-inositol 1-dehydrogenase
MRHKQFGIAVVGAGHIGSLRASMAAAHPAVTWLAISDRDPSRAEKLGAKVGADLVSGDNHQVIRDERVGAVFVSTSEPEHAAPAIEALRLGKPVFVEKPIALTLDDADRMIEASEASGASLHVGYSLRFNRPFLVGKQQILDGKLGRIVAGTGRHYHTKANALKILARSEEATFVKDALTYLVDLYGWFLEGARPIEVVARSRGLVFRDLGHDADEVTFAIVTYSTGAIVNLGLGYALPSDYPAHGRLIRAEVLGEKGVLFFDGDHRENIIHSEEGVESTYVGRKTEMGFLTSNASGNFALGSYWGPLGEEARSWLDYLATGRPGPNTTAREARVNLEVTDAIERAAATQEVVRL